MLLIDAWRRTEAVVAHRVDDETNKRKEKRRRSPSYSHEPIDNVVVVAAAEWRNAVVVAVVEGPVASSREAWKCVFVRDTDAIHTWL
jgi:hypothetical protein